jgi:hypothetical protein
MNGQIPYRLTTSTKLKLLAAHPHELGGRVSNKIATWLDRWSPSADLSGNYWAASAFEGLSRLLRDRAHQRYTHELSEIEALIERRRACLLTSKGAFGRFHDGTPILGQLCYLACRYLRPSVVVETGVAHGVTSTYILKALEDNGHGALFSIDLPPLSVGAGNYVGWFVPEDLRPRWNLNLGPAKRLLPEILDRVRTADLFVHDSLHTYRHMRWELETAISALRPGGIAVSDDIGQNRAFEELLARPEVEAGFVLRQIEKPALCGALRKRF